MHFLLGFCLLTSFFFLPRCMYPRESRWGTAVYFPPHRVFWQPGPVSWYTFRRACEVSPPRRLSRGQVRFTRTRIFCRFGDVTARRHLCREHPKGPTTPDPPESFKPRRIRNCAPPAVPAEMRQTNYRRSFYAFLLANSLLNRKKFECLVLRKRDLIYS